MTIPSNLRLKNTIKYPTSIIVGGLNKLGFEIADSLIEQGGYVIIVDSAVPENIEKALDFGSKKMFSFLDYTSIPHLDEDLRRLDYVFYFAHESLDFYDKVSTQEFLTFSTYLDNVLNIATKFDAKFLLTSSIKASELLANEFGLSKPGFSLTGETRYATYTDMELQKYAEGLTLEYFDKMKLDARIVRLGEIVGEGMDFQVKNNFNELILSAVKGDYLKLKNDGLETEWLVHVLDCSYGIIKSQFSKNTAGQIFLL